MTLPALDRRSALMLGAAFAASAAGAGVAFSATPGDRKLVVVILRGAMDGLAAAPPVGDPAYAAARGRLALDPAATLALRDGLALHPRLAFLHDRWRAGELAVLHASASPYRDRSHFDGQDVLESGGQAVFAVKDGWLNRALSASAAPRGAVAIGSAPPLVLRGPAAASTWAPSNAPDANPDTLARLMDLYEGDPLLAPALTRAVETSAIAEGMADVRMGRRAGPAAMKGAAEAAARLLAAPGGPAAAVLSFDGWDTHANQGALEGALALRLGGLDDALAGLKAGLGDHWSRTVVIVATEFGRTVAANGTGGTDHGTGAAAFVLGGAVRGGRVLGDWPGLAPAALYEGRDLRPVNDVRGLFAGVLRDHWGLERTTLTSAVFPNAGTVRLIDGLVRA